LEVEVVVGGVLVEVPVDLMRRFDENEALELRPVLSERTDSFPV